MVHSLGNLNKDLLALLLFHVDPELNVIKQIHAGQTMRNHLNVVVDIIFKEIRHLDNVGMLEPVSSEVIENMDL